ncbi:IQ and AAA domain-containing protein 1-like [Bicyclus anynana]|uniref:IQ and AAA domain-containing protein 1-like n=1 Tax=Bicyclus anynana TaxID=110368 RepID=A0ABM3LNY0_BICAN|nr:IQ and AAA domain-containing protein 1-like [Bicyclus anynana]
MSSDYYFTKWKNILASLESLTQLDLEYQETKTHDQHRCQASHRLSGILGRYIACYNDASDCLTHNLQVQKTAYMDDVVKSIVGRILELKNQLRKLEGAYYQFLNSGLIEHKLTPIDAEFSDIPTKYERSETINEAVIKAFEKAMKLKINNEGKTKDIFIKGDPIKELDVLENLEEEKWWEDTVKMVNKKPERLDMAKIYEVKQKISEETLKSKQKIAMIQAHEKTRQVTQMVISQIQTRERWKKELQGTLNPPARTEMRERGAKLIQKVIRFYFELKRKKFKDCKRDELLQLRLCNRPSRYETLKGTEVTTTKCKYKMYGSQRKLYCEEFKKNYIKKYHEDIAENARDHIRNWFQIWYNEVKFFYDIPKENTGGSTSIIKEEVPSPAEWKEKYEAYLKNKKENKNKTAEQLKFEKRVVEEEKNILRREELKKRKMEAELIKKMMKNPAHHPGYQYPPSKKTEPLIQAIKKYNQEWNAVDNEGHFHAKENFIKSIDDEHICMEVKLEINKFVDVDMREELKRLKHALKEDYKRIEKEMPEPMTEKKKRKKRKRIRKIKINDDLDDKLTDLAVIDVLKEYPRKDFTDFSGDTNFAGDDIRCLLRRAQHFAAETRSVWWERCRAMVHGFRRILLVGPRGCGKSSLVHTMAYVNDAILYELDPQQVSEEDQTTEHLQQLVGAVATCAKATQPSVIHIKDIHKFYYTKIPPDEKHVNLELLRTFFVRKLFKKFHRHDNVSIIGTCTDPWLARSKLMLKKFPAVCLLPDTSYSAVHLILSKWVLNNRIVPADLDIHSLAHVLQGYSYGYLVKTLDDFLTADRIVRIAAHGLTPQTVYEYIIEDSRETKVDYQKYIKWYTEKTRWGKIESQQLQEDQEFRALVEQWKQKMQKKKKLAENKIL